jgi:hypothetical protein
VKVYGDRLTRNDLLDACRHAGVRLDECEPINGSRVRKHGYKVRLTGSSNRPRNSGVCGADWSSPPATWDEHGHFFAFLYALDSDARLGYYKDRADFEHATDGKYPIPSLGLQVAS